MQVYPQLHSEIEANLRYGKSSCTLTNKQKNKDSSLIIGKSWNRENSQDSDCCSLVSIGRKVTPYNRTHVGDLLEEEEGLYWEPCIWDRRTKACHHLFCWPSLRACTTCANEVATSSVKTLRASQHRCLNTSKHMHTGSAHSGFLKYSLRTLRTGQCKCLKVNTDYFSK